MTPLAFELMRDLTTPGALRLLQHDGDTIKALSFRDQFPRWVANGSFGGRDDLWRAATEAQFFDLTAISDLVWETGERMREHYERTNKWRGRLAFLPADKTWIEMMPRSGRPGAGAFRMGWFLDGGADAMHYAKTAMIMNVLGGSWNYMKMGDALGTLRLVNSGERPTRYSQDYPLANVKTGEADEQQFAIYAALAFINTPKIIGRVVHLPHQKIEHERLKSKGLVGKFPLRAWTEIILKVAPPDDRTGEPAQEAHLTGERCLHFCRSFLRVRLGQLEYVNCHWRGDPALGMKRSRYIVEPGDAA